MDAPILKNHWEHFKAHDDLDLDIATATPLKKYELTCSI